MKKSSMLLMLLLALAMQSHSVVAQSVTVVLMPGWNWISVPLMDTLDFEMALGSVTPAVGDIIKSRWGAAIYTSDGQWRGSISQFYPGYGYHYKSNRTMPVMVTFTAQQSAPQVIVTTAEPTDITTNSAICGGNVASSNGDYVSVTLRGICWSTNPNPTFNDNYVEVGNGLGAFTTSMTDLAIGTTYYVRAFAVTVNGTIYGNQLSFSTEQIPNYTVTLSSNPTSGGTATGGGSYEQGQSCMVSATANMGYTFINWKENGSVVSTNANYTFIVAGNRTLVANFTLQSYTISVSASPSNGGSVSGGDSYNYGQSCTVHATANTGYTFTNWTVNGSVVSTNANYTFTVTSNRNLVANFIYNGGGNVPTGAINGLFTINSNGDQVYFSQGNLQYIGSAATPYWKFADNQWDCLGTTTGQNSTSQNVDRDLFGWGTSGYNHGAICYQPWSTSTTNNDYFAYGQIDYNLYDQTGKADWGYNPISNGGNQINQWRTLTIFEWKYVFNIRTTVSGIRYAKAQVNNVNGLILLPDGWMESYFSLNNTNQKDAEFSSNTISTASWSILEQHGAVFLPAAGDRSGTSMSSLNSQGRYCSASADGTYNYVYYAFFSSWGVSPDDGLPCQLRHVGHSVRLVRNAQ